MFIKGLSTRHTAIGTFRRGVVYKVDEKDRRVQKAVLPLLKGEAPALEKISKANAEKAGVPAQFTPAATAPDADATAADLRKTLAELAQKARDAEAEASAAEKRASAAEAHATVLEGELQKAAEARDDALANVKDLTALVEDLQKAKK